MVSEIHARDYKCLGEGYYFSYNPCYLGHKGESGFVLGTACSIYNVDNVCIYYGHRAMV